MNNIITRLKINLLKVIEKDKKQKKCITIKNKYVILKILN
jgi:hypothetical protein